MKRIAIIVVMALMSLTASATSIRYFTYPQASRTVQYLNAQNEMMIYCGYDYEIETYVLINEVWMERVNSAYYELWVYGYDAYTGDEIYMPLDLQCVWLFSAGRVYNAAQYLRFHATVHTPSFRWFVPPYNSFARRMHQAGYARSYHYDIHRYGWVPPATPAHGWGPHTQPPLPPYYMRTPQTPAPAPASNWTPGLEHPQVNNSHVTGSGPRSSGAVPTTRQSSSGAPSQSNSGSARSGNARGTQSSGTTTTTRGTGDAQNTVGRSSNTTRSTDGTETRGTERRSGTTRSTATTPTRTNTGTATQVGKTPATPTAAPTRTSTTTRESGTTTTTTTRSGNARSSAGSSSNSSETSGRSSGTRTSTTRNSNTTRR